MRSFTVAVSAVVVFALLAQSLCAGPCLPVTKPPLGPDPSWTGPPIDPHAKNGQWFKDRATGQETYRTHEFHDNVLSPIAYGGGSAGHLAIRGYATNVEYAFPEGPITQFDIVATIENDAPGQPPWEEGSNSHGEGTSSRKQYIGTLYGVKLAAEFAYEANEIMAWDPNWTNRTQSPYSDPLADIHVLEGYDQLAWYCWTPNNPQDLQPTGGYLVLKQA